MQVICIKTGCTVGGGGMLEIIRREAVYLWYYFDIQLRQIFWYWILGMVLGSAVSVFLKNHIHNTFRSLGEKKPGVLGIVIAGMLGIASPLCMYGTIPIAVSFSKSGIKDDWLAVCEKPGQEYQSDRIVFSVRYYFVRGVSTVCAAGYNDGSFWRKRGMGRPDGRNHRRTAVCLRRRYDTAFAGMAL